MVVAGQMEDDETMQCIGCYYFLRLNASSSHQTMTPEEFRVAFLEAQNGLGNSLQTVSGLSSTLAELATQLNATVETIRVDYARMNAIVEEFLDQQNQ